MPPFYLEEAEVIGMYTLKAVEKVLASPKYVSHAYRSCEGILSLRKNMVRKGLRMPASVCLKAEP